MKKIIVLIGIILTTYITLYAEVMPAMLDITQALGDIPAVTPASTPDAVSRAIQSRFDYLAAKNVRGRVFLPAGDWIIDKPIFMFGDGKELVGAGEEKTTLRAATGKGAMPMVNVCVRSYQNDRPFQSANRPPITGIYDNSVTIPRYGLRSYTEFPAANFPQESHINIKAPEKIPDWQAGTEYKLHAIVLLHPLNSQRGIDAVCIKEHTADKNNQPYSGADWQQYWVLRLPFNVQFTGDPLAAGAYNKVTKRATNWAGMSTFTLDFAFTMNADPAIYKGQWRPIVGAFTNNANRPEGRAWMLALRDGRLEFSITMASGNAKSWVVADCKQSGVYRLSAQLDFAASSMQAWAQIPNATSFTRTVYDTTLLANSTFLALEYGFGGICMGESGNPPCDNGNQEPPTDITVIGYHLSATPRYADNAELLTPAGEKLTDNQRYFTNDAGTMAFLPLTDNWDTADIDKYGALVTVQHGDASGDAQQQGYGYLNVPSSTCGIVTHRISDMKIVPGPTWGVGIVTWNLIDSKFWNLQVQGGYYAIGSLFKGAQYTLDIRDSTLSGSEAAINGDSNILYLKNVKIQPVGRCGILLSGSNCVLDGVTFADPTTFSSEYYFRHIFTTIYGGMNSFNHVRAMATAGTIFPSKAAFSQQNIWHLRTSMIMNDCQVANMDPEAVFLNLEGKESEGNGFISLTDCQYTGSQIAAFIQCNSPWWSGAVFGQNAKMPVKKMFDQQPLVMRPWKDATLYRKTTCVAVAGKIYQCIVEHTAKADNAPGTQGAEKYWLRIASVISFSADRP